MKPAKLDLTIYQGATFKQNFLWEMDGAAVDISNSEIRMQIRNRVESPDFISEATVTNGKFVIGNQAIPDQKGKFELIIPATETATFNFDEAVYDIEIEIAGFVRRLVYGCVKLNREVTR